MTLRAHSVAVVADDTGPPVWEPKVHNLVDASCRFNQLLLQLINDNVNHLTWRLCKSPWAPDSNCARNLVTGARLLLLLLLLLERRERWRDEEESYLFNFLPRFFITIIIIYCRIVDSVGGGEEEEKQNHCLELIDFRVQRSISAPSCGDLI